MRFQLVVISDALPITRGHLDQVFITFSFDFLYLYSMMAYGSFIKRHTGVEPKGQREWGRGSLKVKDDMAPSLFKTIPCYVRINLQYAIFSYKITKDMPSHVSLKTRSIPDHKMQPSTYQCNYNQRMVFKLVSTK